MKLLRLYMKNYAGIKRASGLNEICIDFTKCISNIILIIGPNGSGKTTILDASSPLPDSNSSFIDKEEGVKEISYIDGDVIYNLRIVHPVKYDGTRSVIKGFITKINPGGDTEELNSNGNITSYKDTIYSLFGLDPNYVSLTKLSMDDRGIVSKSPNERKRFVTAILESVEVYNNIYKTLSKRASAFKSLINSAASKISAIGNGEELKNRLVALEERIKYLTIEKEKYSKSLSDNEASIKVLDPDGSIQEKYNNIVIQIQSLTIEKKNLELIINRYNYKTREDLLKYINSLRSITIDIEKKIDSLRKENEIMFSYLSKDDEQLKAKKIKLSTLTADGNLSVLQNKLDSLIKKNEEIKKLIPDNFNVNLSVSEFAAGMNTLNLIIEDINRIKEQAFMENLKYIYDVITSGKNMIDLLKETRLNKLASEDKIRELKYNISLCDNDIELMKSLGKRPVGCSDDSCPFIKSAVEAQRREPVKKKESLEKELFDSQMDLTIYSDTILELEDDLDIINRLNVILRSVESNKEIFIQIGASFILDNTNVMKYLISEFDLNGAMQSVMNNLEIVNQMELYKNNQAEIEILSTKLDALKDKIDLINELNSDIKSLSDKLNDYNIKIDENTKKVNSLSEEFVSQSTQLNNMEELNRRYDEYSTVCDQINTLSNSGSVLSKDIESIRTCLSNINKLQSSINNFNSELEPAQKEQEEIKFSLKMLEQYQKELELLNLKYEKVEMVRKYSSPSKGIQTLYMELYMGKTLKIANELLSMLFDGDLVLMDYIINENEFRIPVKSLSSSIINDDIKSCSSAQRSMISMIISLALSTQGSGKCNIIRLDEVDSPLDEGNRASFIPTINKMMMAMHISQCLMISHSSESELSNVDIISLNSKYEGPGNVIFQY